MSISRLPLVILGGSDRTASRLPPSGTGKHALCGYKGAETRVRGRPLIALVVERMRASEAFDPIVIAGPARLYASLGVGDRVIDTDGTLAQNVLVALHELDSPPVALTTCDVLPTITEIRNAVALWRELSPCDLFFPLVVVPDHTDCLGVFAWKPVYRIRSVEGEDPTRVLPGHLVIVDSTALRLGFLSRLTDLVYRSRNRPIGYRKRFLVRHMILDLLMEDVRNALRARAPNLTWTVIRHAFRAVRKLRNGELERSELEDVLARLIVRPSHRKRHPNRGVRLPLVDATGWARDIDTEEEEREIEEGLEP